MRENTVSLVVISLMLMSLLVPIALSQPPMPPCWFYGTVSVDGLPGQDDLNVTAVIRGTNLMWTTKTKNGTYGWTKMGSNSFYVPSDDPDTPGKDGGVNNDVIEFSVNGVKTNQTGIFEHMSLKRVDLAIESTPKSNGPPSNLHLLYAALVICIVGFVVVLLIHKKFWPKNRARKHAQYARTQ